MNKEYNRVLKEVNKIVDGLGKPIDPHIKKAVFTFRYLGLSTTSSCEGHLDWGLPYPWVEFNIDSSLNKQARIKIEDWLSSYNNNEYLYLWNMGIFSGFRLQTLPACNMHHLLLLREEMNKFIDHVSLINRIENK